MSIQDNKIVFNSFKLEGFDDIEVNQPGIQYYIELIKAGNYFAFVKRTHGFWDLLVDLTEVEKRVKADNHSTRKNWVRRGLEFLFNSKQDNIQNRKSAIDKLDQKSHYKHFWNDDFISDLLSDLQNPKSDTNYIEAISFRGYPRKGPHAKLLDAKHEKEDLREALLKYMPVQPKWHDALVWKEATFSGELRNLVDALKDRRVIVIGPPHLESLGGILEFKDYHHVSIHPTEAIKDRHQILGNILQLLEKSKDAHCACILQAGALAYWLIYRLFDEHPGAFYLDMGRVLDVWYPEVVSKQPWFIKNRELLISNRYCPNVELNKFSNT